MQHDPDLRRRVNVVRSEIPAVTHVDYSARLQTVDAERNPRLLPLARGVRSSDRLPGAGQHQLQRSRRADRLHARRRLPLLPGHRYGRSRYGGHRHDQGRCDAAKPAQAPVRLTWPSSSSTDPADDRECCARLTKIAPLFNKRFEALRCIGPISSLIRLTRHCGSSPGSGSFSSAVWLSGRPSCEAELGWRRSLPAFALTIGPVGLARPEWMRLIYVGWMILAFPIGWTVSQVMLAVIFLRAVHSHRPCISGLLGRDPLHRARRPELDSYWVTQADTGRPAALLQAVLACQRPLSPSEDDEP